MSIVITSNILHLSGRSQVYLTLATQPVCIGSVISIICYYPNLREILPSGDYKYLSTQPSWKKNGSWFIPNSDALNHRTINATARALVARVSKEEYYMKSVYFSCYLLLNDGLLTEDISSRVLVDPPGR